MPTSTETSLQKSPDSLFIGLESYTEAQSAIFYGRDQEIGIATNLLKANTLTIVFGKSGTGKTSLLNAGVFPRLRKDYCLPFRIRLEFKDDSPELAVQIKKLLKAEIDKYGFKVESYPDEQTTLWEYFHREPLWNSITPILIFDQFEEIFTLARKNIRFSGDALSEFWQELADLIENSIPDKLKDKFLNEKELINYRYKNKKAKILFSFREEFLPEFENITSKIPSIKYSRFRLMPMNGNQAFQVITKTWGNKIDKEQANKIVGFFSNDPEKNIPFDLMEIEPSLLSQVCSHIDKERIASGNEKISAEFLDKFSKEIILRSIYEETLTESNNAVVKNPGVFYGLKPVNEFLEDKLITDEGFRIQYSLTAQDEKLKPGIEVLKRKYFIRDDEKSIELTHDVLTPIIKSDREARRKEVAVAAARKHANRRAVVIVVIAAILACIIWYAIANKAVSDKNEAVKEKAALDVQISGAKDTLQNLGVSIKNTKAQWEAMKRNSPGIHSADDSAFIQMNQKDSEMAILQTQYNSLLDQKNTLASNLNKQKTQLDQLMSESQRPDLISADADRQIQFLQRQHTFDSTKLALLQNSYATLSRQFYDYKLKHPELFKKDGEVGFNEPDTNRISLNLHYSFSKKVPANLAIFLIPYNNSNAKIIKKAKVYEVGCDLGLYKAKDMQKAKFQNGNYYFNEISPGKYFIKICGYYGGYRTFNKQSAGDVTVDLDAAPPIR